jgi:ADP-ribose pyrophosphatase YjhB (NUDIX family)
MKTKRMAVALCEDSSGNILMGKRRDNGKYTSPGGCLNKNEPPEEGMFREFKEETGYEPVSAHLLKVYKKENRIIYLYKVEYEGEQDTSKDPDKEVEKWDFVDPTTVVDNLHIPLERNCLLQYYMEN